MGVNTQRQIRYLRIAPRSRARNIYVGQCQIRKRGHGWRYRHYRDLLGSGQLLPYKVHPLNMVVLNGYRDSDYSVEGLRMCTAYYQWATWKWLHFFWYMGLKTKAKVGITSFEDGTPVQGGNVHDININEHPQAFCLTRLWIYTEANIYSTDWWYSSTIKIFDDYGNQGNFILDTGKENRNQIILKDNSSVTLESSDSGTIHYGKENTISNTLPEDIPEDIRDAILAKQSRIA
ncbi:hypothetical protein EAF04_002650 [Stromatinia cepivora]|nr:hypothetical protein EAF04_002650 [Stromatinia cepivora]